MILSTAILLIVIAVVLLLIEIFLIPGTGVVGIIGFVVLLIGVYGAWSNHTTTGYIVLGITAVVAAVLVWLSLRPGTWDKFALNSVVKGKVGVVDPKLKIGDTGKAISRIAPMGKALFGEDYYEVTCRANYIEENTTLKVVKINSYKIIVEPINESPT